MADDRRLWDACEDLLAVAVAALAGADTDGLLPDVQTIQLGPRWPWDPCERLVVHPEAVRAVQHTVTGAASSGPFGSAGCAVVPTARLVVTLLLCVPKAGDGGNAIPSSQVLAAAAERLHVAGMTVWKGIARARVDGLWGDCGGVTLEDAEPTGAQGGFAGWRVPVTVDLT